jgi:predicted dehydrogenase/threonine dehydrogenase-like Zn-dependent dehydrogenase
MKQLLKSVSDGKAFVADVPAPTPRRGEVVVRVAASVISAGTEKRAVEFASKNVVQKALSRPDLVSQVVDKAKREGIVSTWNVVRNRLNTDLALGYSCAGTVIAVGEGVSDIVPGQQVACAGGGYASHAEIVRVPRNLVSPIPKGGAEIAIEDAAFTTIASIALQGFRLAEPQVGETVAVLGLGLIGLLLVQIAKAAGCVVIGMDPNPDRCSLARTLGCDVVASSAEQMRQITAANTDSHGADAVVITAATPSSAPVALAGDLARSRGRVIVVGAVGLTLPRQPFYDKELVFRVSCSYGPGRYDPRYEEGGQDYPIGFARWTENRNMQAVLQLMSAGKLRVQPLITHRFPIDEAELGYNLISGKTKEPYLGIVISYGDEPDSARRIEHYTFRDRPTAPSERRVALGLLGAGNFATGVLLPAIKKAGGMEFVGVCTASGATAFGVASRLKFRYSTTDPSELIQDETINTIAIATRHHAHAAQVRSALAAGKNVFCEKPLCITESELASLVRQYEASAHPLLMVGFNRRFAPLAVALKRFMESAREPFVINCRVNAGYIPLSHWVQGPVQGAGRIIGEVCHFVDFCSFVTGSMVTRVQASSMPNEGRYRDDNVAALLTYQNGSVATITYAANGDKSLAKERIEVFSGGTAAVLDDFRSLILLRSGRKTVSRSWLRQDKGHEGEWRAFASALRDGGAAPIPFESIVNTTLATFRIAKACKSQVTEIVDTESFIAASIAGEDS